MFEQLRRQLDPETLREHQNCYGQGNREAAWRYFGAPVRGAFGSRH
jgi:hypothetical protein